MPKESKTFNGWGGGVNLDRDPSDLRDDNQGKDELMECNGALADDLGRLTFAKATFTTDNSKRVAGYDTTGDRILIHDDKHYVQDGIYKVGPDINWANNTDYRPEIPINGRFNPTTPANTSNGIDIKMSVDNTNHVVLFSGKTSSFNDGLSGIVGNQTRASADDIQWGTTDGSGWAWAWDSGHWTDRLTGDEAPGGGSNRKNRTFDDLSTGDMTATNKVHDNSTNGGAGDGGYFATINAASDSPNTHTTGLQVSNSVIGGDLAYQTENWDRFCHWKRATEDDSTYVIMRLGDADFNGSTNPISSLYGISPRNITNYDLYVEARFRNVDNFHLVWFAFQSDRDTPKADVEDGTDRETMGWALDAASIVEKDGVRNYRVYKFPWEAKAWIDPNFNPSEVKHFYNAIDYVDGSTYAASANDLYEPRLEVKEVRLIPSGNAYNWAENLYTFWQTTVKNGIESIPFRYRDVPQGGSQLNSTPYSFLYGVNSKYNMTLYKPAASGDAGKIYYQELDENNTIKGGKFLLAEYDFDLGVRWADTDDFEGWTTTSMTHEFEHPPVSSTYTFESGYPEGTTSSNALFKTSAVIGRQVYIGNCAKQSGYRNFNLAYGGLNEYASTDNFMLDAGSFTHAYAIISYTGIGSTADIALSRYIILEDALGVRVQYGAISGSTSGTSWQSGGANYGLAELKACILSASGHNGSIRVRGPLTKGGSGTTYYLVLTQRHAGHRGNTAIQGYMGDQVDLETDFIGGDVPLVAGDQVWIEGSTSNNSASTSGGKYFPTDTVISADLATNAEGTGRSTLSTDYNFGAFYPNVDEGILIANGRNYDLDENGCNWTVYSAGGSAPTFNASTLAKQYIDFTYGDNGQWQGFQLDTAHMSTLVAGEKYRVHVNISLMPAGMDADWKVKLGGVWSEILHTTNSANSTDHDLQVVIEAASDDDLIVAMKNGDTGGEVRFNYIYLKGWTETVGAVMNITTAGAVSSSGSEKNSGNFIVRGFSPFDGSLIMKSAIGRPAGFSNLAYIDMEFGGDEITVMESAGDRLFVFTENKAVIINVAQDIEFVEGTFESYGITTNSQICKVGEGLAWVNRYGVYFFDGQQVSPLTSEKYSSVDWGAAPSIAFFPDRARLLVWIDGGTKVHVFSFETNAWVGTQNSGLSASQPLSRSVNDGTDTYYRTDTSGGLKKLGYEDAGSTVFTTLDVSTGEIDFDDMAREKKFYKIILRGLELDNVKIRGSIDGGSYIDIGTTTSNTHGASTGTDEWSMPALLKKGRHLKLQFIDHTGNCNSKGRISDVTIVYRNRRIK